jgi:RNA polymerase sigma factor (sigma-70 family)
MKVTEEDIKKVIKKVEIYINSNYYGSETEDMIAASSLGIAKAIATFDPEKSSFITYGFVRGIGEARDYIRDVPSIKHRYKCKRAKTTLFSQCKSIIKEEDNPNNEFSEFDVPVYHTGEYNLEEIRTRILDYYEKSIANTSEIRARVIVEHFIDGVPKYILAQKYKVTPSRITQMTNEEEFKELLNRILEHCFVA